MPVKKIEKTIDGDTYMANTLNGGAGRVMFNKLLALRGKVEGMAHGGDIQSIGAALLQVMDTPEMDAIQVALLKTVFVNNGVMNIDEHFAGSNLQRLMPITFWLIEENFGEAFLGFAKLTGETMQKLAATQSSPQKE